MWLERSEMADADVEGESEAPRFACKQLFMLTNLTYPDFYMPTSRRSTCQAGESAF
jgi:hypothetical protein